MHKKMNTSYKSILVFFTSFIYFMSWYPPQYLNDINLIKGIFWSIKIISFAILIFLMCLKKMKWNLYYTLICITGVCIFFSGILNFESFLDTTKVVIRVISIPLFIKMGIDSGRNTLIRMVCGSALYFFVVCTINTIQIILVGGQEFGHYFFLGGDNGIALTYFAEIFFIYIRKILLQIKFSKMFFLSVMNLVVYALLLEVGAVKLWLFLGITFYVLYIVIDSKIYIKIFKLKNLLLANLFSCIVILVWQLSFFQNIINSWFYGKYASIASRVQLWLYFLNKSLEKPFWGYGAGLDKYNSMQEGYTKWILMGNCHNIYVEIIYHYGFITFVITVILLFFLASKLKKNNNEIKKVILGAFLFLFLMHGLVEIGYAHIFLYLPFLYYSDRLVNPYRGEKYEKKEKD